MSTQSEHSESAELALQSLRKAHFKLTGARKAIIQILAREHGPFSIEELHRRLRKEIKKDVCDLVTVYRCLATFEKLGLVSRCDFRDGTSRYELRDGGHHHHHIVCTRCKAVEKLDLCLMDGLERLVRERGYTDVSHALEFFGVCAKCRK